MGRGAELGLPYGRGESTPHRVMQATKASLTRLGAHIQRTRAADRGFSYDKIANLFARGGADGNTAPRSSQENPRTSPPSRTIFERGLGYLGFSQQDTNEFFSQPRPTSLKPQR